MVVSLWSAVAGRRRTEEAACGLRRSEQRAVVSNGGGGSTQRAEILLESEANRTADERWSNYGVENSEWKIEGPS